MKKSSTTPNLLNKSRRLLDEEEDSPHVEEDEDEETLKLKLAAIEAKLKLKRLQSKAKATTNGSDTENHEQARPKSAGISRPKSRLLNGRDRNTSGSESVEVPQSPTRKQASISEQKSPSRVLLGIDKGAKAGDVSLRRMPSGRESRLHAQRNGDGHISQSRSTRSVVSSASSDSNGLGRVKTFSERMAEVRSESRAREDRREHFQAKRNTGFHLNREELQGLHAAAEEARTHSPPRSPRKRDGNHSFCRDEVLKSYRQGKEMSNNIQRSNTAPSLRRNDPDVTTSSTDHRIPSRLSKAHEAPNQQKPPSSPPLTVSSAVGDTSHYDPYAQVHLTTRILPHSFLQRTLSSVHSVRLPYLLKTVKTPDFELPDSLAGDFAVFGIIASVSKPYDHKDRRPVAVDDEDKWSKKWDDGKRNDRKFMVLTLTDLKWTVDLFLFGTAVPRYHRLHPGTVVAILNPGIMPPKPGKEDTGAFSLTIHSGDETVLEIGTSQDLGFCKSICKSGRECGAWIDKRKTEFCDFHVDLQVQKVQASRMGVNGGSNAFAPGGGRFGSLNNGSGSRRGRGNTDGGEHDGVESRGKGLLPARNGSQRDKITGERYFISSASAPRPSISASNYSRPRSAAAMIEAELDDPFLAEGTVSRDIASRSARVRKHLASQQQERDIARKLGGISRSTGSEYLRFREEGAREAEKKKLSTEKSAEIMKAEVLGKREKRGAENVRLSPAKKTRFVTDRGIKEAGRESLGPIHGVENADEDDLDIV
ncbi:MAG: hypothetical protein Q9227_003499 [Pyrenula ochraceoflavens]